jgi:hypothetical protein
MFNQSPFTHNRKKRWYLFVLFIPLIFLALSFVVMFLWNAILPDVAHAGQITYWQSLGLLALCRILFGGFGHRGNHKDHHFARSRELREKWTQMNEEERQKFKEEWRDRCKHRNK